MHQWTEDPVETYKKYRSRLEAHGNLAPFPEFKDTVTYLRDKVLSTDVSNDKALSVMKHQILLYMRHLDIDILKEKEVLTGPFTVPISGAYPYRHTIDVILKAIEFFEVCERISSDIVPLYHTSRYYYHYYSMIENHDIIIFPTTEEVTFADFLVTRCVPVAFVGVTGNNKYFDGYVHSPLEFFIHDVNHARLMSYYTLEVSNALGFDTLEKRFQFFESCYGFFKSTVLPYYAPKEDDDAREKKIKDIFKCLMFELFHEYAVPMDAEMARKEVRRCSSDEAKDRLPFEFMVYKDELDTEVEAFRKPNGGIKSGILEKDLYRNETMYVKYSTGNYGTIFSTCFEKLKYEFYFRDSDEESKENVVLYDSDLNDYSVACERVHKMLGLPLPEKPSLKEKIISVKGVPIYPSKKAPQRDYMI